MAAKYETLDVNWTKVDGSHLVDNMGNISALRNQLSVAPRTWKAMGGGLLDVRGGDNGLCDAGTNKVEACPFCGTAPYSSEQIHGHYTTNCCKQILEGCCQGS